MTAIAAEDGDPAREIMEGTYRALCEHGYADLTMQAIADDCEKSTAALHYHYDSKHDLLLAFLEFLSARFEANVLPDPDAPPETRLRTLVDDLLTDDEAPDTEFRTAIMEIKAQAPYEPDFQAHLADVDESLRAAVRDAVAEGVERGDFRAVDPDDVATFVVTAVMGAYSRRVAVDADIERSRALLHGYLDERLVA